MQQHDNVVNCYNMEQCESQPLMHFPNLTLSNESINVFGLLMTNHEVKSNRGFVFTGAFNTVGLLVLVLLTGECVRPGLDGYVLFVG